MFSIASYYVIVAKMLQKNTEKYAEKTDTVI